MTTDLHSHLLPGIDDGSQSAEQTAPILRELTRRKIKNLALTPHYDPTLTSLDGFLKRRERAYSKLSSLPESKQFCFSLGAEVYFTEHLLNNEILLPLCFENTRFLLTELETKKNFTSRMERDLLRLVEDRGITPILAHIDRYPFLRKDEGLLFSLRQMGCLFQVNFDSFFSFFGRRRTLRLAQNGWIDFLGQDLHRTVPEEKAWKKALCYVEKNVPGLIKDVDERANSLIFRFSHSVSLSSETR